MSAATFTGANFDDWAKRFAAVVDRAGPLGLHGLEHGRFALGPPVMPCGLYIGVTDDRLRYVGMVDRRHSGIVNRLAGHSQPIAQWTAVWLLPLAASSLIVSSCERRMIAALRPPDNVQHIDQGPRGAA